MNIKLYKIANDRIEVNKTLIDEPGDDQTLVAQITAHFKDNVDILNPVLEVTYDAAITEANYCVIPEWNRCYFIEGMTTGAQRLLLRCRVDVLQTYAADIKKLVCVTARQESIDHSNQYLNDGMFHNLQYKQIARAVYGSSFSDTGDYVLAICGES